MRAVFACLLLAGCNVTLDRNAGPPPVVTVVAPEAYTRSEIDAINLEIVCRQQARNLLQMARCNLRR
jgi:hypothetical protein